MMNGIPRGAKTLFFVFCLLAGLALIGQAAPLSGSISTRLEFSQTPSLTAVQTAIEIDYNVAAWTLGSTLSTNVDLVNLVGLWFQFFEAETTIGDSHLYSVSGFSWIPSPSFYRWLTAAKCPVGSVTLYSFFSVSELAVPGKGIFGSGFLAGGWGSIGDISIWCQMQFNMPSSNGTIQHLGYEWVVDKFVFAKVRDWIDSLILTPLLPTCSLCWSGANIIVEKSLACFDLITQFGYEVYVNDHGVYVESPHCYFRVGLRDVNVGIPWLMIKTFDTTFRLNPWESEKEVLCDFDLVVRECACFTPYLSVQQNVMSLEGIALNALLTSYTWNGVTFKAGHLFSKNGFGWWDASLGAWTRLYGFDETGALTNYDELVYNRDYDEYFAIVVDGDRCGCGPVSFSLINWFDTGHSNGIFDWTEMLANLEVGIGSNIRRIFGVSMRRTGLNWFGIGFEFEW